MKGLFIQTFGCQMNQSDSDRMRAVLAPLGFESVKTPEDADVVLVNTCSVREKAEGKTQSFTFELQNIKEKRPETLIGITGCVAQQEKEKLLEDLPFVNLIIGPDNIDELPWILEEKLQRPFGRATVKTEFDREVRVWNTRTEILNPGPTAFISVMKGCDHFCSYCIVPYTRGREKSRPINDIYDDVGRLTQQGVKEVTFLGQNINTFGKRAGESLEELFRRVHDIEGLKRIRFTTSHPGDLKDSLIRCFEDLPKLCSQFHLPVQSGSNRVLRDMRRFYTREQYIERARALRQARPDIAFSTDIIVGFPGETEEDLESTLSLMQEIRYDNVYSFLYSKRPGTAAATREDTTPESVKLQRLMRLQFEVRKMSKELHVADVGSLKEVLIEGVSKKNPDRLTGRTSQNVPVHIDRRFGLKVGDLAMVRIVEGAITHMIGEVEPNAPASADLAPVLTRS